MDDLDSLFIFSQQEFILFQNGSLHGRRKRIGRKSNKSIFLNAVLLSHLLFTWDWRDFKVCLKRVVLHHERRVVCRFIDFLQNVPIIWIRVKLLTYEVHYQRQTMRSKKMLQCLIHIWSKNLAYHQIYLISHELWWDHYQTFKDYDILRIEIMYIHEIIVIIIQQL